MSTDATKIPPERSHDHPAVFARYNMWANRRLYAACAELPEVDYMAPRSSFFGSLHHTLNHILVGDRLWLGRIVGKPESLALDAVLHDNFADLQRAREAQDGRLISYVDGLDEAALDTDLHYANSRGEAFSTPLRQVFWHLFNHQTHHRGQVHDLLSDTAIAPPSLDLIYFLREAGA